MSEQSTGEAPDAPVPVPIESRRLGTAARDAIRESLEERLRGLSERARQEFPQVVVEAYGAALTQQSARPREAERVAKGDRLDAIEQRLIRLSRAREPLETLRGLMRQAREALALLRERFPDAPTPPAPAEATDASGPEPG